MMNPRIMYARSLSGNQPSEEDTYSLYVERVLVEVFNGDENAMEVFSEVTSRGLSESEILIALPA